MEENKFKIGVAVPCHESDLHLLQYCLRSIKNLKPQPFYVSVDVNQGKTLRDVRTKLFDNLIDKGCDVVFQCSVDFYLFPNVLKHVKRHEVCSFANFYGKRYDLTITFLRLLFQNGWSGCYSLPKEIWQNQVKQSFDGTDSSVRKAIGKFNWSFRKSYSYFNLRPYKPENTKQQLATYPLWKQFVWQIVRLKVVR